MFPDPLLGSDLSISGRSGPGYSPRRTFQDLNPEVEPTPYDVVHEETTARLRYYESEADETQPIPVVFVYAFINTPAVLDLDRDRSVVGQFLERGYDVYVVEWTDASPLDVRLTLDDYVGRFLDKCVDTVRERAGAESVNLLGFSTGSTLAGIYAGLYPEKVRALALQGAPLDFDVEGGIFEFRELVEAIDHEQLVDALGTVPSPVFDAGFALRKPVEYPVGVPARLAGNMGDQEALERFARLLRWAADGPDLPGGVYEQYAQELFEQNSLLDGEFSVNGRLADLDAVTMPVGLVLGTDDAFVPRASSVSYLDAVSSDETTVFDVPASHVGTLVDEVAHQEWWPEVVDWFSRSP